MYAATAAEYCDWETFNVSCQADELIAVGRARYGRMTLGRCVTTNYGSIGCGADVTAYLDSRCSGRRACAVNVITLSQLPLQTDKPCPPDFKYYLEATYECLKGTRCAQRVLRFKLDCSLPALVVIVILDIMLRAS